MMSKQVLEFVLFKRLNLSNQIIFEGKIKFITGQSKFREIIPMLVNCLYHGKIKITRIFTYWQNHLIFENFTP